VSLAQPGRRSPRRRRKLKGKREAMIELIWY
jgi:hypothetical protein